MIFLAVALFILFLSAVNSIFWPAVKREAGSRTISILIPARNEESNLPECLDSAVSQGEGIIEILVYDDHSTDGTSRVIESYAERDPRVKRISPEDLPPGWCGKNFACHRLASASAGDLMLFIDADARLVPGAASRMAGEMRRRRLTFLSCWPGLEMRGFWEKALMPTLNYVVFSIFPAPLSLFMSSSSLALAHGACLMFERATYQKLGGHAAVRDQIFEDTRLAQLWRENGERGLCLDGQSIVRVRMYNSFGEIWQGFQKNFYPAFRRQSSFWAFIAYHGAFMLLPFFLILIRPSMAIFAAVAAVITLRAILAFRFRHPLWSALLHPVSETILLAIGLTSWWRCRTGRGVAWKGRQYMKVESKK